jgi:hypothetical protein
MKLKRNNQLAIALVILATLATSGCIHKTGAVTPWERVHTYNAALAEANNALEQGAEAVVSSSLLSATQAAPIIGWTGQVATIHLQVTAVLQTGQATTASIASVQALVDQLKQSVSALPLTTLGLKNPKSQNTFQADVTSLLTLADAVMTSLKAVNP